MDSKEVVREALAALDESADAFTEHVTDDAEFASPFGTMHGRDEIRDFVAGMYASFSDWKHDVRIEAAGDLVVIEGTWNGTHSGPMPTPQGDVPATGIRASVPFAGVVRVRGDQLASVHNYFDTAGMMAQFGLTPEAAKA
jgi:limonene-1,2-epoxide hydrolase